MASSWAAASAATLALFVLLGLSSGALLGERSTMMALGALLAFVALASWALALVMAAHGHKGALVALVACAMLAAGAGAFVTYTCGVGGASCVATTTPFAGPLVVLAGVTTVAALAGELRKRRGPVQASSAALLVLPMLLHVLFACFRLASLTATK